MASFRNNRAQKPYSRPETRLSKKAPDDVWVHDKAPASPAIQEYTSAHLQAKLLVSNLHYEITTKDLMSIFGQIGTLVREPLIRYDRSGRSTGVAVIFYETPTEATSAKKQFDGILAKGQPMSIVFDNTPPHAVRNAKRATGGSSLLNRIEKPPLLDRLSKGDSVRAHPAVQRGMGPIRSRERKGARPTRAPKKPQTVEDLDKELDAFMGDEPVALPASGPAPPVEQNGDVDMV